MDMTTAIRYVTERRNLSGDEMQTVMHTIMSGGATPAQIAGFLIGLRMKGETVEEIVAGARVMRELVLPVEVEGDHLVDTCGTGGDAAHTFNISTASAFVAAAAGARVAKHGNRSVSSSSGSADVLEAAGVFLNLTAEQVATCIDETGVGFMFAPSHHGAMKHAIGARREMGVRTLFNLLGPLTNPAGARHQVIGVFDDAWVEPLAKVLTQLGSRHVLVVHSQDGLDEISIGAPTRVAELKNGLVRVFDITGQQFGIKQSNISALRVDSVQASLAMMREALAGQPGPARDIVALNAGAALYAADVASSLSGGVKLAADTLDRGLGLEKLEQLVAVSNRFRPT